MTTLIGSVGSVLRRDLLVQLSYPFQFGATFAGIGFSLFSLFFLGRLVGSSPYLEGYESGYFEFALIGTVVLILAGAAMRAFNSGLQAEARNGTFEILLASPVPLGFLVAGWMAWPLLLASLEGALSFGIGWLLAEDGFDAGGVLAAMVPFTLTVATFLAIGLIAGAFTVISKRGDPLTPLVMAASTLVAGAVFPVEVLPGWIQVLARLFPAFYGFNAMRAVLIGGESFSGIVDEVLILVVFNLVLIPLGMWALVRALHVARVTGTLATS
jgi:ABC-2 type transport system permease protein